jgi:hypothetical protein
MPKSERPSVQYFAIAHRHVLLLVLTGATGLLMIAAILYPGGALHDRATNGFSLQHNYLCHLFNTTALNGKVNEGQVWAYLGMFLLCLGFALFFRRFSHKIATSRYVKLLRYSGLLAMIFAFLVGTPWHDTMTTLACVFAFVALTIINASLFRSKLTGLKVFTILCMGILLVNNFIYYTTYYLECLAILQKVSFVLLATWMLALDYGTKSSDFV